MDSIRTAANRAPASDETVLVGEGGALQNVFVYVKDGLGDLKFPVPSTPVVLDQKGCHYTPHVVGVQVGQAFEVLNSDPTLHNVHALPTANRSSTPDSRSRACVTTTDSALAKLWCRSSVTSIRGCAPMLAFSITRLWCHRRRRHSC